MKSSSISTLLIELLKKTYVNISEYQELNANLIWVLCLLTKATFSKVIGIEPLLLKNFVGNLPGILQSKQAGDKITLYIVKTLGTFYSLAALVPNKMSNIYKSLYENQLLQLVVELIKSLN